MTTTKPRITLGLPDHPRCRGGEKRGGLDGLNVLNNLNYEEVKRFLQ